MRSGRPTSGPTSDVWARYDSVNAAAQMGKPERIKTMVFSHASVRAAALVAVLAMPAFAQDPTIESVVATVGPQEITIGHVLDIKRQLPEQYQTIADDVLFKGIIDQLVRQTLLSQSLESDPSWIETSLENERRNLKAEVVMNTIQSDGVTEASIQALYDERFASQAAEQEYNASHILVETEEAANTLVAALNGGADFAETAKEHSTGPSGPNGGSLGWFGKGQMVKPFEDAVLAMAPDEVSNPVQTQFGWHIIKLIEIRNIEPPTLDSVRGEIENELVNRAIEARLVELETKTTITRNDADFEPSILSTLSLSGK